MALEIFKLVGSVFVDTDEAEKSLQKTDKTAGGLGNTLVNGAKTVGKFAVGFAGAAAAAGGALVAIAESTREYRNEQGKLQAAFEASGHSADAARSTYQTLNGVLGDSGQAVEASSHLALLATNEKELEDMTNALTGVYATFGASLPVEGLAEAMNHTAKLGEVQGPLADALEWVGITTDEFNAKLATCSTEQERSALITETLNSLYGDAADKYRDVNGAIIDANMAQENMNAAMAAIGGAVEPFITAGKILLAEVLQQLTPILTQLGAHVIPFVTNAIATVSDWITTLVGRLSSSGITFDSVMGFLRTAFQNTMNFIQGIWTSIGQPVWNFIKLAVDLVANLFRENMPAIKEFVRQAFSDIKQLWENNLKPAFEAIGNFIENVLAPAFKFVFDHVIAPVVKTVFHTIKNLWTGTLKPVLQGIIDFVGGIFSGNFTKAFSGIVSAVKGIFSGLGSVVKAPLNAVISIVNSFIKSLNKLKIPDWVPGVGGKGINIPTIPLLAEGGVLERGQVGLLEGNGAEAVVPLHQNKQWISAVARDMDSAIGGTSGSQVVALLSDILEAVAEIAGAGLYLDGDALVGGIAKRMDNQLGRLQAKKARA